MKFLVDRTGRNLVRSCAVLFFGLQPGCAALLPGEPVRHSAPIPQAAQSVGVADDIQAAAYSQLEPSLSEAWPASAASFDRDPMGSVANALPVGSRLNETSALAVEELVEQVLARNPSLAQMVAAWQAASARYPQAISLEDPMFGTMMAPASIGSNHVEFGYRLEVSQKVPFPGKRALRGQAALAQASAASEDVQDMRLQLVESAKLAFYDFYLVERALAVNDEGLRLLQEFQKNAETRYKTGSVSQQDVLQASVETGRQRQRRLVLERMRCVAIARINTLLHRVPDDPLPPPSEKMDITQPLPEVSLLRATALDRRPDLRALAERLRAEQASLDLAYKEFYPDFEVTGAYDTIMGNGPTRDLAGQVGLRINLPIRHARRYGALGEAEARVAQRQAELAKQVDQVAFQVQEAYEQVREGEQTVHLYEETILPAAQANIQSAQSAYITARIPFLTLIEAQRGLVELKDRYYEAVAEYFRRLATLERAAGGPLTAEPGQ